MNLPDSFYIALCMTILLVGAVYWVWTQIQYVQRKVNVLENIVYELKTVCSRPPDVGPVSPTQYPPAPSSVLGEDEDLLHETLAKEVQEVQAMQDVQDVQDVQEVHDMQEVQEIQQTIQPFAMIEEERQPEPIFDMSQFLVPSDEVSVAEDSNDLQPGGVGSGVNPSSIQSSLDGMTLKELRRLAQQKGISGANDMKKKELITAIRAIPIDSFLE